MRKRLVCGVLCCAVLLLAASTAAAAGLRGVTGGFTFQSPDFWYIPDPQIQGWMQINAREVGPGGEARGWWRVQLYKEDWGGWRRLDGRVLQVAFGEYESDPAVAVLIQVTRAEGWGTAEGGADPPDPAVGEYGWLWFHDGGSHRGSSDHLAINNASNEPLKEYWPELPDDFGFFDPGEYVVPNKGGNLTIHGQ